MLYLGGNVRRRCTEDGMYLLNEIAMDDSELFILLDSCLLTLSQGSSELINRIV
jgi:hypothetical protein